MSAAKGRKGKPKKPLSPRKALEVTAHRLAVQVMRRQRARGIPEPSATAVEFDDLTGWAKVAGQTMPSREVRRT